MNELEQRMNEYRMSTQEWLNFQQDLFDEIVHKTQQKNQDYTAGSGDPFANFREAEDFGVEPLTGLSVRMGDKFQRVKAYLNNGELAVQNEGIRDAFMDIIGYAAIAIGMLHEQEQEEQHWDQVLARYAADPNDMIDESTWTAPVTGQYHDVDYAELKGAVE